MVVPGTPTLLRAPDGANLDSEGQKKDARLALRDRRQAFLASEDRRRLQIHSVKVTANKLLLLHQRKTGSIAQHMGYVKRVSSTGLDTKGKNTTILPILLAASMSVGPTWERARLLVDSGSEHPPLTHGVKWQDGH